MTSSNFETVRLEGRRDAPQSSRFRVVIVSEAGPSTHALPASGDVVLGRGDEATIKLDDVAASRRHAVLHVGATVRLEDLGSANGTLYRGRRLDSGEQVDLQVGDSVEIGTSLLVLQRDDLPEGSRPWNLETHQRFLETIDACEPPFSILRMQVLAAPGVAQEVLSSTLAPDDTVASFGPGQFEVLALGRAPAQATALAATIQTRLTAAGAKVRLGLAHAPQDGTEAEALIAASARPSEPPAPGFIVRDDAMTSLYRMVDRVAPSLINVLLLGETGVGKEVLASEIHHRSKRATGPFVRLNCAALTESLLESELFGHEKGSFTGAIKQKLGLLESAKGGTVLLDEIGEVPGSIQAKLLRVLEERQVLRVGAIKPEPINVRFIFATNRDLEAEVARGAFRADLFYRVNGISLVIPPLRERVAEIEPLARQFIVKAAQRESRETPELTSEALMTLKHWPWPGNIRELRNVVERAVLLAGDSAITSDLFALGKGSKSMPTTAGGSSGLREEREAAEKRAVLEALDKAGGNQTKAAELLGISRRTLVNRLQDYGLTKTRKKPDEV